MKEIYKAKRIDPNTLKEIGDFIPFKDIRSGNVVTVYKSDEVTKVPHVTPGIPEHTFNIVQVDSITHLIDGNIILNVVPYITDEGYAADAYPMIMWEAL